MQSLAALVLVVCAGIATPGIAAAQEQRVEHRVLATNKTSTMQKELAEAGDQGFDFVGLTVANTAIEGTDVVAILRRKAQ